ncbi:MAG TPA: hypothetical protein VI011_02025 [Asanoa sp.]
MRLGAYTAVLHDKPLPEALARLTATHVGAEMDPSHLFWQGIDPAAAIDSLGRIRTRPPGPLRFCREVLSVLDREAALQ